VVDRCRTGGHGRLSGLTTYDEGMVAISLLLPETPPPLCRMVCDPHRHVFVTRCAGNEMRIECMIRDLPA
jgi:3-(3-hydroxy-phenyl)propionate hydroxylase